MADLPISGLPSAGALSGTEPLAIVQAGATKQTTVQDVANLGLSDQTFTKDANGNIFYNGVTATLGTGCSQNIFYQGSGLSNTLGNNCIQNIFEPGVSSQIFGNNLNRVTIKSGVIAKNYTASPDFDFLYNNPYPSTIFLNVANTTNYHSYFDPVNNRIVLTNLTTLAVSYIGGNSGGSGITKLTASGTDTYTATISGVTSYTDGDTYLVRFTNGNTTGATLNINSLGAKTLYRNNDGAIIGGDIWNGGEMLCVYNSTLNAFQCIGTSPNSIFAYVTNADSVTITKGQVVYAFGGTGDRMTVKLANNSSDATSARTVGVVLSASIGANQKGIIILQGLLDGLSILGSPFVDGDSVYLGSTNGSITRTKQYAPNHLVYIGTVTTASAGSAGRMYVKIQNGYEMDELHNVSAQTPANKDGLFYNTTTSLWESRQVAATDINPNVSNTEFGYLEGVTSAIQTQINGKENTITAGTTSQYYRGDKTFQTLDKTAVGLGNVDNTSDANKPISTATQTALNAKVDTFTMITQIGTWNLPAASTTYYAPIMIGIGIPLATVTTFLSAFSFATKIVGIYVQHLNSGGVQGSNQNVAIQIRNNTTSTSTQLINIQTNQASGVQKNFEDYTLNVSIAANDSIALQINTPAWTTLPTNAVIRVTLFFQRT